MFLLCALVESGIALYHVDFLGASENAEPALWRRLKNFDRIRATFRGGHETFLMYSSYIQLELSFILFEGGSSRV